MIESLFTLEPSGHGRELSVHDGLNQTKPQNAVTGDCGEAKGTTQAAPLASASPKRGESMGTGMILLVEDEETLLRAVAKMFRKKGYSVLEAANGNIAVDLLRHYRSDIALTLLDVNLPGLSSREVFDEARRIESRMLVILTSAFSQNLISSSFTGVKVDRFIPKPYRLANLVQLVQNVLSAA